MNIRPLGERIIVQRLEAETMTESGIHLPAAAQEKPQEARVIRTGTGKTLESGQTAAFQVNEGDTVLLSKWGGTEVEVEGEDYLVLNESDVLGVMS